MSRIFLSHSSQDNAAVIALRDWLVSEGWNDLFLDLDTDPEHGIVAGERWERMLNAEADRCEAVLFLVSRAWIDSPWCRRELHLADKLNKRLFGVLIEDLDLELVPSEIRDHFQLVNLAAGRDHKVFRAALPDGHEEHVTFSTSNLAQLKAGLIKAGLDAKFFAWPPANDPDRSPYRGLQPLEAEDAGIFFGREASTIAALDRLRGLREQGQSAIFVILGASGSGKSSFLRAGLLPRLGRDDVNFSVLPIVRPERSALHGATGLVASLAAAARTARLVVTRASITDAVDKDPGEIVALLKSLRDKARAALGPSGADSRPPTLVLPFDQGEELFPADEAGEAGRLLTLLRTIVDEPGLDIMVLFTIRTEAYEPLQAAKALEGVRQDTLSLLPVPRGAYQTIIESPAMRLSATGRPLKIDPALTEALLKDIDAGGGKDALPLLSFTLQRLFLDYGGDGDLLLHEYRAIGGIAGSIEAAVDEAFRAADADDAVPRERPVRLALLRRGIIPWLAGIDPDSGMARRRVARLAEIPEDARPLIRHLVDARLLATGATLIEVDGVQTVSETTIEPAHEALLRQWGLLEGWLEEDFAALTIAEGVTRAAQEWEANGRQPDWLAHSGGRLEDAEALHRQSDFARFLGESLEYLGACREAENARRDRELRLAEERVAMETEAKTRAENALKTATATANRLVFGLAQKFKDLSVPAAVTRSILEEAKALQDTLAENFPDDLELQRSRSVALGGLGDIYALQDNLPAALAAYEEGLAIARALAAREPTSIELRRDVSVSLDRIGDVRLRSGDAAGALAAYEEALGIARSLAERDTDSTDWQRDISISLDRIGDVRQQAGDARGAIEAYEESLGIARALAVRDETNPEWQRDISVSLDRIGDTRRRSGNAAAALAAYEEALAIRRALASRDATNTQWQGDVSVSLDRIGDVRLRSGDVDAALASYEEGLDIRRALVAQDETNTQWRRNVSVSLDRIGDVRLRSGDTAGALAAYEEGIAIRRELAARDETNAQWQRDVALSLDKIGDVRLQAGDGAEALAIYEEGLDIVRALAARDETNTGWQSDVAVSLERIADVRLRSGDPAGALAAYEEGLRIRRALAAIEETNTQWQHEVSVSLNKIGDVRLRAGDTGEALAAYEEGLNIRRGLSARDETNTRWQRDVSVSLDRIGDVKLQAGDTAAALAAYEEALGIRRALAARDETNTQWQRDVSVSLDKIGNIRLGAGEATAALEVYEEGLCIALKLAERDETNAEWQRDVAVSLDRIGDIRLEAGDAAAALAAYMKELRVARTLAASDQTNAEWQRGVATSLSKIGDIRLRAGDTDKALASYEEGLAIRRMLAERDQTNIEWQTDLFVSLWKTQKACDDTEERVGLLREALSILEPLELSGRLSARQREWPGVVAEEIRKLCAS